MIGVRGNAEVLFAAEEINILWIQHTKQTHNIKALAYTLEVPPQSETFHTKRFQLLRMNKQQIRTCRFTTITQFAGLSSSKGMMLRAHGRFV